jgi:hypothetical protein
MACRPIVDDDNRVIGLACGPGQKHGHCWECGLPSSSLCDGPGSAPGKTCDLKLCYKHAVHVTGKNLDYCRMHGPKGGSGE